jgi:hypothetical protein
MRKLLPRLALPCTLALAAACGGTDGGGGRPLETSSTATRAQAQGGHDARDLGHQACSDDVQYVGDVGERVVEQLELARRSVCKYRRIEAALAAGYADSGLPCVPGQGYHFIKSDLVGSFDVRRPPVLMYTSSGDLNSPEWIAPQAQFPTPPSIFGQTLHAEDELGLWILHVWVWKANANGVFDDVNPSVTCP